jgi:ABC-type multidrug transport system fused ATPase/permease subunit
LAKVSRENDVVMSTKSFHTIDFQDPVLEKIPASGSLNSLVVDVVYPYRKWLMLIFIFMLVESLMGLAAPWPLKIIIDNVVSHQPLPRWLEWTGFFSFFHQNIGIIIVASVSVVLIAALGAAAGYADSYFTERVAQHVANDLRKRLYHHLQRLSLSYYDTHQIGKVLSTLTSDVSTIQEFTSSTLLGIIIDFISIFGMICIMFYLNWDFAMIAVGVAPFLLLFVARFRRTVKKATRRLRADQSRMLALMEQGLISMRTVNAFGRQDLEEEKLRKVSQETVVSAMKARQLKSFLSPVVAITVSICVAFVLYRGTMLIFSGLMTIGSLTVFLAYLNKFFNPVQDLAKLTNNIAGATVALERIQSILKTDVIIPQKPGAINPAGIRGDIVFDHVFFSYLKGIPVLKDLSLSISAGQHVGICGPTGSGKSTLASLIPRFYDPQSGQVKIDGIDITNFQVDGLRNQIAFVLQDTVLFYGSIRENIAYGRPEATDKEIVEAARMANAEEFILKMPEGYNSLVGERGLTLSGGQRQRIGIARAIIRNAPILILDEPTASIDAESERTVIEALEKLMRGRTVITFTHHLNTIRHAEKIVVLLDGSVAEQGIHETLVKKGGVYSELLQIQTLSAKLK